MAAKTLTDTAQSPTPTRTLTPTERAREWVLDLPEDSLFWLSEVPAPPEIASVMLSRLARQGPCPPVQRLANGFYWRAWYFSNGQAGLRDQRFTALVYAGKGCGYADCTAVNAMGWSTQIPARVRIAVMRDLTPRDECVKYLLRRANPRRLELDFGEVSVIEAVRDSAFVEVSWDEAVDKAGNGTALSRLGYNARISADMIRWAAQTEPPVPSQYTPFNQPKTFKERINYLCDRIPEVQYRKPRNG